MFRRCDESRTHKKNHAASKPSSSEELLIIKNKRRPSYAFHIFQKVRRESHAKVDKEKLEDKG